MSPGLNCPGLIWPGLKLWDYIGWTILYRSHIKLPFKLEHFTEFRDGSVDRALEFKPSSPGSIPGEGYFKIGFFLKIEHRISLSIWPI